MMTVELSISMFAAVTLNDIPLVVKFIWDPRKIRIAPYFLGEILHFRTAEQFRVNGAAMRAMGMEISFGFTRLANYLRKRITKIRLLAFENFARCAI